MSRLYNGKISTKIKYLCILIGIAFLMCFAVPTLSRYINRTLYYEVTEWDGSIASSYRSGNGSEGAPYIIANASEFAFFLENLKNTNYENTYFKLNNDIVLNKGLFINDNGNIKYTYEKESYNINDFDINKINMSNEFSGTLDGNNHKIFGIYISSNDNEVSLFKNLNGSINNLYIENSFINGGFITSGLAINSSEATISNLLIDGYLYSFNNDNTTIFDLDDITSEIDIIDLNEYSVNGNILSAKISGINESSACNIKINDSDINSGAFSVELSSFDSADVIINDCENINLNNLKYEVVSDFKIASGLIVNAENTNIKNISNKLNILSNSISGFIYTSNNNTIKNSYFSGSANGRDISGFINTVNGQTNISNSYASFKGQGNEVYSFINHINSDISVNINSSYSILDEYAINSNLSSELSINNSYIISNKNIKNNNSLSEFDITSDTNIMSKSFIINTLNYKEYLSDSIENDAVWLIKEGESPILYLDDLTSEIASINVSIYSWNNLSNDLNNLNFSNRLVFKINVKELSNIKSIYYYIHEGVNPISDLSSIEFNEYTDIVEVNEDGNYIIYAKIVDSNDNVIYMNSDILSIGSLGSLMGAVVNNKEYNTYHTPSSYVYLPSGDKITININEGYANKKNVRYYISEEPLEKEELDLIENNNWQNGSEVSFDYTTPKIVYFKVIDKNEYTTYINTDYILINGFTQSDLTVGRELVSGNNLNISSTSSIKFTSSFLSNNIITNASKYKLSSTEDLPANTKITLIDKNSNKVYTYTLNDNMNDIDLSYFEEVGKKTSKSYFSRNFNEILNDNFDIILDFKDTNINENINNISVYLKIVDIDNNISVNTLENSLKKFNIYINAKSHINLSTTYDRTISYNMNYLNVIPYELEIAYYNDNNNIVYDSSYEDMNYGIEFSLYDLTNDLSLEKSYLSSLLVSAHDKSYHPYNNGIIDINLSKNLSGNINIETFVNNIEIDENNEYAFKMCPYISYNDRNHSDELNSECIYIPVILENNLVQKYDFDVKMTSENRVIQKGGVKSITFDIIQMSHLTSPNVRASLYEKNVLSAYDQSYKIMDIIDYTENDNFFSEKEVYVFENASYSDSTRSFTFDLITDDLKYNGYKLVFELYDGDKLITTIDKNFIIKKGAE